MIHFQQAAAPDHTRLWPVVIGDDGGVVHGRPDALHLAGFATPGTVEVPIWWRQALEDPESAVGLVPVFIGHDGKMFSVDLPVEECATYEASDEAVAALQKREQELRDILTGDVQ